MTPVTVPRQIWNAIEAQKRTPTMDLSLTTFNPDGTVTMQLTDEVLERLETIHPDPVTAIAKALGVKPS